MGVSVCPTAVDHFEVDIYYQPMRSIPISEFKASCLRLIDEIQRSGETIRITRRGKVVAKVAPQARRTREKSWMGAMSGSVTILGDIVEPVLDDDDLEAFKE